MNTWKHFSDYILTAVLLFLLIGTFAAIPQFIALVFMKGSP